MAVGGDAGAVQGRQLGGQECDGGPACPQGCTANRPQFPTGTYFESALRNSGISRLKTDTQKFRNIKIENRRYRTALGGEGHAVADCLSVRRHLSVQTPPATISGMDWKH